MTNNPDLTSDHRVFADLGTPADTALGCDHRVWANFHVVGYLDQVIQLCPGFNQGGSYGRPVDGGVRTDLHEVFDNDVSYLGHFLKTSICLWGKSKSIRSEY